MFQETGVYLMAEQFSIMYMTTEYRMPLFNEVGIKNYLCAMQTSEIRAQNNL